jgi:hypothetical protein
VLVQVKNKRERSSPVRPPSVEKTSSLGLRDSVSSGVKCGPHGGKNSGTKSWTVSWLSLKTKLELGQRGSRVMSGDWRRLHRVRGVCSGSLENHWVTRLSHKTEAEDSTRRCSLMRTSPVHLHQQHLHSRHHLQGQSLGLVQES